MIAMQQHNAKKKTNFRRLRAGLPPQKMAMSAKKFCLFCFFGAFATHLVYLGELAQIKYTAVRNKSVHYSQFVEEYLHRANKSYIFVNRTKVMSSYYHIKNVREAGSKNDEIRRVLLITSNPRSGSSFTGELLTAMPNVSYFFEPLWFLSRPNKSQEASQEKKIGFVAKLLNCRFRGLKKVMNNLKAREFVFKKPNLGSINLKTLPLSAKNSFISSIEDECSRNPLRVTKLFRLRLSQILPEMRDRNSALGADFKVILLQRDPRATINSLLKEIREWLPGATSPSKICGTLLQDFNIFSSIENEAVRRRIMVVKYEDIVLHPKEMVAKMYRFMNATEDDMDYALQYLESHYTETKKAKEENVLLPKQALKMSLTKRKIRLEAKWRRGELERSEFEKAVQNASYTPAENAEKERQKRLKKYYGTSRPSDFKPDHWRTELDPDALAQIMRHPDCQKVLRIHSYPLL